MFVSGSRQGARKPAERRKPHPEALLVDHLVDEYVKGGKPPEGYRLTFEGCVGFVRLTAASMKASANLPFSMSELVSAGSKGLADGLMRYQPVEGAFPSAYLGMKIRGAILDWFRTENPIPKAAYDSGARLVPLSEADTLPSQLDPGTIVMRKNMLEWALTNPVLSGREKEVLIYEIFAGLNQAEIGAVMGLSTATICRIRSSAICRLRAQLEAEAISHALPK